MSAGSSTNSRAAAATTTLPAAARPGLPTITHRAGSSHAADDTGIAVTLVNGTVVGASDVGSDMLRSMEAIWGTNFADSYDASTFSGSSTNAGNAGNNGAASGFNEFEGGGGDDS